MPAKSKRLDVYISSTIGDLAEYRQAATEAIMRIGMYPITIENLPASPLDALTVCYNSIQTAEIFIGIYALRYGYVPPETMFERSDGRVVLIDGETSIIQLEYLWASERGIPMLIFMLHPETAWNPEFIDTEIGRYKLENFKEILQSRHVTSYFSSPDSLKAAIIGSLATFSANQNTNPAEVSTRDDCIQDFDGRVLNAVLQALAVTSTNQSIARDPAIDDMKSMRIQPVFIVPPSQLPQYHCDVFVIMPFDETFTAVYTDAIKTICEELNLKVRRGDDFFANSYIMDEVWYALCNCRLVIADCTGRNANVFYELGIAHTLGKPTIPIAQDTAALPFDIKGRRVIEYETTFAGAKKLKNRLSEAIIKTLNNLADK